MSVVARQGLLRLPLPWLLDQHILQVLLPSRSGAVVANQCCYGCLLLTVNCLSPVTHAADGVKHKILRTSIYPASHQASYRLGARDELFARDGMREVASVVALYGAISHQQRLVGE